MDINYDLIMSAIRYYFLRRRCSASKGHIADSLLVLLLQLILISCLPSALADSREARSRDDIVPMISRTLSQVCAATQHPDICVSSLSAEPAAAKETHPVNLIKISIHAASKGVKASLRLAKQLLKLSHKAPDAFAAASECSEILDYSVDWLRTCNHSDLIRRMDDVMTYLSAVLTYQGDCYSALQELINPTAFVSKMMDQINEVSALISNSLSMLDALSSFGPDPSLWKPPNAHRKHKKTPFYPSSSSDPWMFRADRELLEQDPLETITPSVTVSQNGLGNFSSIQDAVDSAPAMHKANYSGYYIIYIKEGVYYETVRVPAKKTWMMFVGDGTGKTVITGNRSVSNQPSMTTFESATVGISSSEFLARDLTFENTAGPSGHQAVALRVDSDKAAFYRCEFLGYQDTLYSHVLRQFYKECHIQGTIDFIFGNAATVFQNCDIRVRIGKVSVSTITAQGRSDPAQTTGFVLQNCTVNGTDEYMQAWHQSPGSYQAYLGRPWKSYSTTIFMETYMEGLIQPEGWMPWNGSFALSTLFYGEYDNTGPGSNCSSRVKWSTQLNHSDVLPYSVGNFIQGDSWLPLTTFPFDSSI